MKIINFCPTGTQTTRKNSFAPLTSSEIVEETQELYEKGMITLVHIHARDNNLLNSWRISDYNPIIEGLRKYCPDLAICTSLSGRYFSSFEERSAVLELRPDMGSLTMGSWNYMNGVNINSPEMILSLANRMNELNIVPEIECFDSGMLNYTNYLISKNILKPPYYINMIFGNMFNAQIDEAEYMLRKFPKDAKVCFGGIGDFQMDAVTKGLELVDGCRIGLEDNFYYTGTKIKITNYELVKQVSDTIDIIPPILFKKWLKLEK